MRPLLSVFPLLIVICAAAGTSALVASKNGKAVVCYVASWAVYRKDHGSFDTKDLDPELCTHFVYAFAGLDVSSWTIRSLDHWRDTASGGNGNYRALTSLKKKYPEVTISLAIGGWNEGSKNYSDLVKFPERRNKFVNSVVQFLGVYGFHGFDLDWEFPGERGGDEADKENFVALVKELSEAFRSKRYHLTAAISANIRTISKGYDIPELSKYLDYIHVMTYDYHSSWDRKVLANAPLRSNDDLNVESSLKYLINEGAPPNKLVMGLPFYGRTFVLTEPLNSTGDSPLGKPCEQTGFKGPYTGEDGFMGYNEICEELVRNPVDWRTGWDEMGAVPYMIQDKRVIIYDDIRSIKAKIQLAKDLKLGGLMVWSIDTDDFRGKCSILTRPSFGTAVNFPLTRTIVAGLRSEDDKKTYTNQTKGKGDAASFGVSYVLLLLGLTVIYV